MHAHFLRCLAQSPAQQHVIAEQFPAVMYRTVAVAVVTLSLTLYWTHCELLVRVF